MSAPHDGGPAFPVPGLSPLPNGEFIYPSGGMTLRDYFAGEATQDDLSLPATVKDFEKWLGLNPGEYNYMIHFPQAVSKARYVFADAMLRAREGGGTPDLIDALHRISLASQNSMSSKEECGRIAREALAKLAP